MPSFRLEQIVDHLRAELQGDPKVMVDNIAPLDKANPHSISFLAQPRYRNFLDKTEAAAVILQPDDAKHCQTNKIITANPYLGFAKVGQLFQCLPPVAAGVHPTAVIGKNCRIADTASIGAYVVIGDEVTIGERTIIHPHCVVGTESTIGDDCTIWSNVTLYYRVVLGHRVGLHSGVVIGSDGFGLANDQGRWQKVPQLGAVIIADDVEIGANTTVDRGAIENTVISRGVKIDNQVQIAHNVQIGENTAIAAGVGIAGSTKIGKNCILAGKVGISDHIEITDGVIITAASAVSNSITEAGVYSSSLSAHPHQIWRKNAVRFLKLDEFVRRLLKLEKTLEQ